MVRRFISALCIVASLVTGSLLGGATAARAEDGPDLLSVGAGAFDVLRTHKKQRTVDYRLEYRSGLSLVDLPSWVRMSPWGGLEATGEGGFMATGGVLFDINLGSSFMLTPNFGVGLFSPGNGANLGSLVEFRSSAELSYRFENQSRIGVSFGHISNAGLGTSTNPGSEIITLYYHIPTSWITSGW